MFEKYFDGVIEQVYGKVLKAEKNIVQKFVVCIQQNTQCSFVINTQM